MKVFDAYAAYYDLLYRDKDYAGEAAYVLSLLAERGGMCADLATESADLPSMTSLPRISASSRKRSVIDVLQSLGMAMDAIIEANIDGAVV